MNYCIIELNKNEIEIRYEENISKEIKDFCYLGIEEIKKKCKKIDFEIKSIECKKVNINLKLTYEIENRSTLTNDELKSILSELKNKRISIGDKNAYIHFRIVTERRIKFTQKEIEDCLNFSYAMKGKHNKDIIQLRTDDEIFRDDFRGKLGEIALKKYVEKYSPHASIDSDIDFEVNELGIWDITDMIINDKYINVKSVKGNGQFLMVEKKRYNKKGEYIYKNNDGSDVKVDYYVLVRVSIIPEIPEDVFTNRLSVDDFLCKAEDNDENNKIKLYANILGIISHERFLNEKKEAPRGMRCNLETLKKIINGEQVDTISNDYKIKNIGKSILQQDNYIMHYSNLDNIDEIILEDTFDTFSELFKDEMEEDGEIYMDPLEFEYNAIHYNDDEIKEQIIAKIEEKIYELYCILEEESGIEVHRFPINNTLETQTAMKIYEVVSNRDEYYKELVAIIDVEIWENSFEMKCYDVSNCKSACAKFINGKMGMKDGVPTPVDIQGFDTVDIDNLLDTFQNILYDTLSINIYKNKTGK